MIGRLRGILIKKQAPQILLEVAGVAYELWVPLSTFDHLPALGEESILHTHLVVREDAHVLYGFKREAEREVFRILIKINGVGPKLALTLLSGMDIEQLVENIFQKRDDLLMGLPGVGKKTAQRLVVELQDPLRHWYEKNPSLETPSLHEQAVQDALEALTTLGYKPKEALRLLHKVKVSGMRSEDLIRAALQSHLT